jgi:hypothetical protein
VLSIVSRVSRAITPRSQALVVNGTSGLKESPTALAAFDRICVVADGRALAISGVTVVDGPNPLDEDDALPSVGATTAITIAGHLVANPIDAVSRYLVEHTSTILNFDLADIDRSTVHAELVRRTRRPWMNSRISDAERDWLVDRARTAPWDLVDVRAELIGADPLVEGGLYDAALDLWNHFASDAPKRVATAKISKVLHLTRPHLYPILDSRLMSFYDEPARTAAREVAVHRSAFAANKVMYWEAVRRDLMSNGEALRDLRAALAIADRPLAAQVASTVSDVRLLDMLAWAAAGEPDPNDDREG